MKLVAGSLEAEAGQEAKADEDPAGKIATEAAQSRRAPHYGRQSAGGDGVGTVGDGGDGDEEKAEPEALPAVRAGGVEKLG